MAEVRKSPGRRTRSTGAKKSQNQTANNRARFLMPASRGTIKRLVSVFVVLLLIILLAIFWYYKDYNDPKTAFWNMIDNNLSIHSVTKNTVQSNGTDNINETILLAFNPSPAVRDIYTQSFKEQGNAAASNLTVERIGTVQTDYEHYLKIDRPAQKGKTKSNYSNIYDMWLKSGEGANEQVVSSQLFGPVLFGNLSPDQRHTLIKQLQKAYEVDYAIVKKESVNGRRTYTYTVKLSLKQYMIALKYYATAYKLPVAAKIDPSSYSDSDSIDLSVKVDALSSQLRSLDDQANGTHEKYSGYGLLATVQAPKKTVTSAEFQKAINAIK
jgi:hypothetical protein